MNKLQDYAAEHRFLLDEVKRHTGMTDPVALDLDEFFVPLYKTARKGPIYPIEGVLIRDWDPDNRRVYMGLQVGVRVYDVDGITIARARFNGHNQNNSWLYEFSVVDRCNYRKLYRKALIARKNSEPISAPPVLPNEQRKILWQNTIGYLDRNNLSKILEYGGRPKRGVLLMGPPGNGKTSACRWIWQECRRRRWEWRLVTPDAYRQARANDSIEELFSVEKRGIVFFDDMDMALRDRETVHESEDQAVFLTALDGISVNEGVVFVFTTNCALELIDRAFKRPGRIDLVLHFQPPDATLRRTLMERWHVDIRTGIRLEQAVRTTEGYSFAEIEELKNLLILNYMESQKWDWDWALRQLDINRHEFNATRRRRPVGFSPNENE